MKLTKSKLKQIIREEILNEESLSFGEVFDACGFEQTDADGGVVFYANSSAKLDGFADGDKIANVGRMNGKDNKVFRNPIKMQFWIEKKFKLKNKYL